MFGDWTYLKAHPELTAYLKRVGADLRNFRLAIVKQDVGAYFVEKARLAINEKGEISCDEGTYLPTEEEAARIAEEFKGTIFPRSKPAATFETAPDALRKLDSKYLFFFRDSGGDILFVQHWVPAELSDDGVKHYYPWSFWSDGVWRQMEPEGRLPLWGTDQLAENTTAFIHEGAKTARHVRWMAEGRTPEAREALVKHPWGQYFKYAAHLGWTGGALTPWRTDWGVLSRFRLNNVYMVCDNDLEGKEAARAVSRAMPVSMMAVKFDAHFPRGFDLGDEWPDTPYFWKMVDGEKVYIGPSFEDYLSPATWATVVIEDKRKGPPAYRIRPEFLEQWKFVVSPPLFIHREVPHRPYSEAAFNTLFGSVCGGLLRPLP